MNKNGFSPFKAGTRILFLVLAFSFFSSTSRAQSGDIQDKITEIDGKALAMGDEAVQRLIAFRSQVETGAKVETLKLCEGYRRARGLGPSNYHGKYVFPLSESIAAWAQVFGAGLAQPFSTVGGLKSDYLAVNRINILAFDSWFHSLYSLYLVHSMGFLDGAMHCLNTMDQREINLFAAAIIAADMEASLATEVGMFWSGDMVLGAIIKATSYVLIPARYVMRLLNLRLEKAHLIFGAAIVVPIAVDNLFMYLNKMQTAKAMVVEFMDPKSPARDEVRREGRMVLSATALQKFTAEFEAGSTEFVDFQAWTRRFISEDIRLKAHQDFVDLSGAGKNLSATDQKYQIILEAILPILDQVKLSK